MNVDKTGYFNSQVDAPWASSEYDENELSKIMRMLNLVGRHPTMKILEPGCGTGRLTSILADFIEPPGYIVASDISEKMVEAARNRVGSLDNVQVLCIELEAMSLKREEFDLVICHQVFPHFEDKKQALAVMAACLKPSGNIVVFHFINSSVINDTHRKVCPAVQTDSMPDEKDMRRMFSMAGLSVKRLEDNEEGYLLIADKSLA